MSLNIFLVPWFPFRCSFLNVFHTKSICTYDAYLINTFCYLPAWSNLNHNQFIKDRNKIIFLSHPPLLPQRHNYHWRWSKYPPPTHTHSLVCEIRLVSGQYLRYMQKGKQKQTNIEMHWRLQNCNFAPLAIKLGLLFLNFKFLQSLFSQGSLILCIYG